ncbi:aldose 1-epimerase [Amylibacter marinus]|uniref:Aldose 1-epimerase n=1 Tax=Amylibacter marinus TaxID=1475483 RepID=A0ABQ5VVV9_9RHOB|nr:aldose epimerase family protein [Amylibacter marinus]GLQ35475.1 aldose 1-epimerase [Amylibacter marinus]
MISISKIAEFDGRPVWSAILHSGDTRAQILSYGAITKALSYRDHPMILGYDNASAYETDPYYLGAIAGRVANRIANARFALNGQSYQLQANDGTNCLHGGHVGLGRRHWEMEIAGDSLLLKYHSPDGEEGFPCDVDFMVQVDLGPDSITYRLQGMPSAPTPINLAQHNYYTLAPNLAETQLWLNAHRYTPVDNAKIPTGHQIQVPPEFDFTNARCLGPQPLDIDHNFILDHNGNHAATLMGPHYGMHLDTDQCGLQVYSAGGLGTPFVPYGAICLEPQHFPNALNTPRFPSMIHSPAHPYSQTTSLRFFQV